MGGVEELAKAGTANKGFISSHSPFCVEKAGGYIAFVGKQELMDSMHV